MSATDILEAPRWTGQLFAAQTQQQTNPNGRNGHGDRFRDSEGSPRDSRPRAQMGARRMRPGGEEDHGQGVLQDSPQRAAQEGTRAGALVPVYPEGTWRHG